MPGDWPTLDHFLPRPEVASRHELPVAATREATWPAVAALDLSGSALIRALYRLRGLPASALTRRGLERMGFVLLVERPPVELVLGIIGRFWTLTGHLQRFAPDEFPAFDRPGFAKAVWGLRLDPEDTATRLVTETRVTTTDPASRRHFRLYWHLVGPFSAWIRREALRRIREQAKRRTSADVDD